jgi:hypothetical protein
MTPIQAVLDDAAAQLDAALEARWDELALQLIADGNDPEDGAIDYVLEQQKVVDRRWRAEVLESLRRSLARTA